MNDLNLEIPIMFCFDNNYTIPASVAFYSLLDNANKKYKYKFFVLHTDITKENQLKLLETIRPFKEFSTLEFINMNHEFQELWDSIGIKGHFSKEVMYKILVASIFPQYEKIIVTDVDVVFLNDLSESYISFDINEDVYLAGTKMIGKINYYMNNYKENFSEREIEILSSFCGGYIVFNLKKIREDNMEKKFIQCFKTEGYRINQMEQDVLNLCCYPKIKKLPLEYVACSYIWDIYKTEQDMSTDSTYSKEEIIKALNKPIQLHYATSIKPWNNLSCTKSEEWFKYLVKTAFLNEFLDKLQLKFENLNCEIKNLHNEVAINKLRLYRIIKRVLKNIYNNPFFVFSPHFYAKLKMYFYKLIGKVQFEPSLLIVDDIFPSEISPFRYQEYLSYLNSFKNIFIITTLKEKKFFNTSFFNDSIKRFTMSYPKHSNKLVKYDDNSSKDYLVEYANNFSNKVAIFTFLNNVCMENFKFLEFLEKYNIPFIFTLYPGGGFSIDDEECKNKLIRVFTSPCFKKVIVTQKITYDFLVDNNLCLKEDIKFIYGIVTPKLFCTKVTRKETKNIDICFVAHKYSDKGLDKGYDLFINSAKILLQKYPNVFFHVVGGFFENDLDVSELKGHIKFYGIRQSNWFKNFYKDKNIIISPNRPFILGKGTFDGFPTGCCTEAMANGVVAFCTDELEQNINFIDKKDLIIIKPCIEDIVKKVGYYCEHPEKLSKISKKCSKKIKKFYSLKKQLAPRINLINEIAKEVYTNK